MQLKKKTVLTSVGYDSCGKQINLPNPQLRLRGGECVPYLDKDVAYKHLGQSTCASASSSAAWKAFLHKCKAAIARLRQIKRGAVSSREFHMIGDSLLGGLAGFYLQTLYISFEQAEIIERMYRKAYNMTFLRDSSSPIALLYESTLASRSGHRGRVHTWTVGLAALHTCVNKAMSDVHDTPQRAACRSMVALAAERLGCREDLNFWSVRHLPGPLEDHLRSVECKYLGDAWWLAEALFDKVEDRWVKDDNTGYKKACTFGRWQFAVPLPRDDPISPWNSSFIEPESPQLFRPVRMGGLGLPFEPILAEAGIVACGHLCCPASNESCEVGRWALTAVEVVSRHRRLHDGNKARLAVERVLAVARNRNWPPSKPTSSEPIDAGWSLRDLTWAPPPPHAADVEAQVAAAKFVDPLRLSAMRDRLRDDAGREPLDPARLSRGEYAEEMGRCFGDRQLVAPRAWHNGARDIEVEAGAVHITSCTEKDGRLHRVGGEANFLAGKGVGGPEAIGHDGFFAGWEDEAERLMALFSFDEEGFSVAGGARLSLDDAAELPPLLQLEVVARLELGDVPIFERDDGIKRLSTHVNLEVQRMEHERFCLWQARMRITAAYTLDASRVNLVNKEGFPVFDEFGRQKVRTGMAAGRHDGSHLGGIMDELEGDCNYLGELGAHLIASAQEPSHDVRVAYIFDATSPINAEERFSKLHDRSKCGYYGSHLLDTCRQQVSTHAVALRLWQTSHVGSPVNEWADHLASLYNTDSTSRFVLPRAVPSFFSMRPSRPVRSWNNWDRERAGRVVGGRLLDRVVDTVLFTEGCIVIGEFEASLEQALEGVCANRGFVADCKKKHSPAAWKFLESRGCAFGCSHVVDSGQHPRNRVASLGTWSHYLFFCRGESMVDCRAAWHTELRASHRLVDIAGHHGQFVSLMQLLDKSPAMRDLIGCDDLVADTDSRRDRCKELRAFAGGVIDGTGDAIADRSAVVRAASRRIVSRGAELFRCARREEAALARDMSEVSKCASLCGKIILGWRKVVSLSGPRRISGLAALRRGRIAVLRSIAVDRSLDIETRRNVVRKLRRKVISIRDEIDESCPPLGLAAAPAWWAVCRIRAWRIWFQHSTALRGAIVNEPHSPAYLDLHHAAFGHPPAENPPALCVPAYRALRACRELGGRAGLVKWRNNHSREVERAQARRLQCWIDEVTASGCAPRPPSPDPDDGLWEPQQWPLAWNAPPPLREWWSGVAGLGSKQRARISRERRGLQASRDGAHAVDEVLDYRRKRSGGIEIFVSWVGVDKSTGAAFSPEWTSLRKASTEVRVEAHALIAKATARRVAVKRKASTTLGVKWKKGYVPPPTWAEDLVISFEIPGADSDEDELFSDLFEPTRWSGRLRSDAAARADTEDSDGGTVVEPPGRACIPPQPTEPVRAGQVVREDGVVVGVDDDEPMHSVVEVLERRKGAAGRWEALVRWEGRHPVSGDPWPPDWIPDEDLSRDLRCKPPAPARRAAARAPHVLARRPLKAVARRPVSGTEGAPAKSAGDLTAKLAASSNKRREADRRAVRAAARAASKPAGGPSQTEGAPVGGADGCAGAIMDVAPVLPSCSGAIAGA